MADPCTMRALGDGRAVARVNARGAFVDGDRELFDRVAGGAGVVRIPEAHREAWDFVENGASLYRIFPSDSAWTLEGFEDLRAPSWRDTEEIDRINFSAVARSTNLDDIVHSLAATFDQRSGMDSVTIVLIDPRGDPTFAGGLGALHEHLAAMETARRNGAPMAIWQAFDEDRIIVDPNWFEVARRDERFAPVSEAFTDDVHGAYVAVPMRVDGAPIGVLSGIWADSIQLTADRIETLWMLTARFTLALRYSEAVRRSRAHGSEAARAKLHDDLHATLAQDVFALSLEMARVAARAPVEPGELDHARSLTDSLTAELRTFIDDPRHGDAGMTLSARLRDLADGVRTGSDARVRFAHVVDWDLFSSAFADDLARVIAEAFRNAVKHAHPSEIVVEAVINGAHDLEVTITDDGRVSTEQGGPATTGVGLSVLRKIVEGRGGSLSVEIVPTVGSTLRAVMPPEFESEWAVAQKSLRASAEPD